MSTSTTNGGNAHGTHAASGTANAFLTILVGLILKSVLDVFFKGVNAYSSLTQLGHRLETTLGWDALVFLQLIVFLFSVTRFYWGSVRYHEEIPEQEGTPQAVVGLVGVVFVFSAFYLTGLLVRNPGLFYWGFVLIHAIDLAWFALAGAPEKIALKTIWSWYKRFDVITIGALLLCIGLGYFLPDCRYVFQWVAAVAVFVIGLIDCRIFWSYYIRKRDWQERI